MVFVDFVKMTFSGLHLVVEICMSGVIVGGGIKCVYLDCSWLKLTVIMLL